MVESSRAWLSSPSFYPVLFLIILSITTSSDAWFCCLHRSCRTRLQQQRGIPTAAQQRVDLANPSRGRRSNQHARPYRLQPSTDVGGSRSSSSSSTLLSLVGDARGDYYGESAGSYMIQEFNEYDQLAEIVRLASQPLPERPDGIVTVAKFTKASDPSCRTTEAEYERLARNNPATLFLRCFGEYPDAEIVFGQASVTILPTFDIFYGGNRVARVEGPNHAQVQTLLEQYQFQNSNLDLFSEASPLPWGQGQRLDYTKTPRTTNRFVPGYDWNSDKGFFDAAADKAENDFMAQFEGWVPPSPDEDRQGGGKK